MCCVMIQTFIFRWRCFPMASCSDGIERHRSGGHSEGDVVGTAIMSSVSPSVSIPVDPTNAFEAAGGLDGS